MKALRFQQQIGGTHSFMNRITKSAKGCVQLSSNDTLFSDIWFSGLKTEDEANEEEVYYCGPIKTSHKIFCLSKLEKL